MQPCVSIFILIGIAICFTSIALTNAYAQRYEIDDHQDLAKIAGRYLEAAIVVGLIVAVGFAAGSSRGFRICAVCASVFVTVTAPIAGVLVSVSTARNSRSGGKAVGAVTAMFNFLTMFSSWCIMTGCAMCILSTQGGGYGRGFGGRGSYTLRPV